MVIKLATQGTLASGAKIGAVDVKVTLPDGVTVKSTTNAPEIDPGVVVGSGVVAADPSPMVLGVYTARSETTPASIRVMVIEQDGFSTGEFATVTCDIASETAPTQADFNTSALVVKDINGVTLSGISVGVTADIK